MADQAWQQMYTRIEQLLPRFLNGDLRQIEYKPPNVIALLEMPSGHRNENHGQQSKSTTP
ncbi:MAG: hypothetical protein ABFD82_13270 [Syntrophaceae bacterium]